MKTSLLSLLGLSLILLPASPLLARYGGEGRGERWVQELNLNEAQQTQIKAIREKYRPKMQEQRQKLREQKASLREMMKSPQKGKAHQEKLRSQHKSLWKTKTQLSETRFDKVLEIREVLDEEQIKNFKMHRKHRGRWRKQGGGYPGQPRNSGPQ